MFSVTLSNGAEVLVRFWHSRLTDTPETECAVEVTPPSGLPYVGVGFAHCHPNDNFCKATGRRIALTRALREAGLNKRERGVVWGAYHAAMAPHPSASDAELRARWGDDTKRHPRRIVVCALRTLESMLLQGHDFSFDLTVNHILDEGYQIIGQVKGPKGERFPVLPDEALESTT